MRRVAGGLMTVILCLIANAEEKGRHPDLTKLLKGEALTKRANEMRTIRMKDVSEGDLTLYGLCRCVNEHLKERGSPLRVSLDSSVKEDVAVEEALKANIFTPHSRTGGRLDKLDLLKQINSNNAFDLLHNLRDLCIISVGWFPEGFIINCGADNAPLDSGVAYRVKFTK